MFAYLIICFSVFSKFDKNPKLLKTIVCDSSIKKPSLGFPDRDKKSIYILGF